MCIKSIILLAWIFLDIFCGLIKNRFKLADLSYDHIEIMLPLWQHNRTVITIIFYMSDIYIATIQLRITHENFHPIHPCSKAIYI